MQKHHRHTTRQQNWNYSSNGYYFVTICSYKHECIFGEIKNGKIYLNKIGEIVNNTWESLPEHHPVELSTCQIMPNHIHGIIKIIDNKHTRRGVARYTPTIKRHTPTNKHHSSATDYIHTTRNKYNYFSQISPKPKSLSSIVRSFKSQCTKQIRITDGPYSIWQRNYHDHIIKNKEELNKIKKYIKENPLNWERDKNNPSGFLLVTNRL